MAIIRIYAGSDGKSHFEEIQPKFEPGLLTQACTSATRLVRISSCKNSARGAWARSGSPSSSSRSNAASP